MMLTLLILKLLQSPAFPSHASTQHLNIKEMFPQLLLYFFVADSTIYPKSPSLWDNLWQSALLHENILLLTSLEVSFLGNRWSSALTSCTRNRWYDSGPSWNPIYFSSWTFPFQSGLLFPVGHTLLPLSGILLDPHSNNFGRCVLLLHMNSKT